MTNDDVQRIIERLRVDVYLLDSFKKMECGYDTMMTLVDDVKSHLQKVIKDLCYFGFNDTGITIAPLTDPNVVRLDYATCTSETDNRIKVEAWNKAEEK